MCEEEEGRRLIKRERIFSNTVFFFGVGTE